MAELHKYQEVERCCLTCNNRLVVKTPRDADARKYCSMACKAKSGKNHAHFLVNVRKVCKECCTPFNATSAHRIYCGPACFKKSRTKNQAKRDSTLIGHIKALINKPNRRAHLTCDTVLAMYEKQNGQCAVSGVPMTVGKLQGRVPTNISIDRIDSDKSYELDNIQLVCTTVNMMKNDMTMDELVDWATKITNYANTDTRYEWAA